MRKKRMIGTCGLFAISMMLSLVIGCASAFADEEGISVQVSVGEHGSVNGHTSDFTESIETGQSLTLEIEADSGYVIGSVLVNEEELPGEDAGGITGKTKGSMDLEYLEEDVTVDVEFEEDQAISGEDEETGTAEDPGSGDTDEAGTEAEYGSDADPAGDDAADEEQSADEGSGETGDSTGEGVDDESDETSADDTSAPDENKDKGTQDTESAAGKGAAASERADQISGTGSPKTGDDFPMAVILLLLSSMAGGAGVLGRRLWKMHISN